MGIKPGIFTFLSDSSLCDGGNPGSTENIKVTFFSDYKGEPTTDELHAALKMTKKESINGVAAIGGGSAIDIAKAVSFFKLNPNMEWDLISQQENLERLPLIAIPTTAGTGSEATKVMVITDSEEGVKMNPANPGLIPDVALLDPVLTSSLPKNFTAYTGMDALTHAIEALVSTNSNIVTDQYALAAIKKVGKALPVAYERGMDVSAREDMLLASTYAGIAFSNASTNLAHAAGRPLGARFHIPHGLSVALLLPFVMRFGLEAAPKKYAQIAVALGENYNKDINELAWKSIELVNEYNEHFNIWKDGLKYINLTDLEENIDLLVTDALNGNGIITNLIVPSENDVRNLYLDLVLKLNAINQIEKV